jgi:hypothetical protein
MARKHARTVAMTRVAEWRRNRNSFWRAYKPPSQHCPFTARAIAQHFNSKLNSRTSTATQPHQQQTSQQQTSQQQTSQQQTSQQHQHQQTSSQSSRLPPSSVTSPLMDATACILPDTMFGFRPGRRCADTLFILRHLVDMKKTKVGGNFCAAFIVRGL